MAISHFAEALAIDASKEGESLLGIALTEAETGDLEKAQDVLAALAAKAPSLTPPVCRAIAKKLFAKARAAGDDASVEVVLDTGHVELIAPGSKAWEFQAAALARMLGLS